ncbi:MAG: hypothetical protein LC104_10405 [Bacteroidales bacterium]|nr:hypothetical protein [Bacteroidales bacterium]
MPPILATVEVAPGTAYSAAPVMEQTPVAPPQEQPQDWQFGAALRRGTGRQDNCGEQLALLEDDPLLLDDGDDELLEESPPDDRSREEELLLEDSLLGSEERLDDEEELLLEDSLLGSEELLDDEEELLLEDSLLGSEELLDDEEELLLEDSLLGSEELLDDEEELLLEDSWLGSEELLNDEEELLLEDSLLGQEELLDDEEEEELLLEDSWLGSEELLEEEEELLLEDSLLGSEERLDDEEELLLEGKYDEDELLELDEDELLSDMILLRVFDRFWFKSSGSPGSQAKIVNAIQFSTPGYLRLSNNTAEQVWPSVVDDQTHLADTIGPDWANPSPGTQYATTPSPIASTIAPLWYRARDDLLTLDYDSSTEQGAAGTVSPRMSAIISATDGNCNRVKIASNRGWNLR